MKKEKNIKFNILNKYYDNLIELQSIIINKWKNYPDITDFSIKKDLNNNNFIHSLWINIYENILTNIKKQANRISPVIKEKLTFLKNKDTSSEEIFTIYKDFRRAVKTIIFHNINIKPDNIYQTIVEIDIIFDNNLKKILWYYSQLIIDDIHKKQIKYVDNLKMYEQIVEHMTESVWIGDEEEKTVYANPEFCKILWYTLEEMLWRESYDFWDEESIETVKKNNKIRKKWKSSKYEWVLKAKDGKLIPVLLSGASIPGGGTVWIMTDLSEIKTLQEAKDELKHLNEQKDAFLSLVGHELRTPLTAIKWYLSMMLDWDYWEINWSWKIAIEQSFRSSERIVQLVNDMLNLSRIESGRMVYNMNNVEILSILQDTYNIMKIIFEKKNIKFEYIENNNLDNIKVYVDQDKLKQVIINLLNNAVKFTPEEGTVKLIASIKDKKVLIEVIDTGIWIPKDKIKKVFDKFYQVDSYIQRKVDWLGLGLSLSQKFIKQFNSSLKLQSEEWKWSNFYFSLKIV